jgi:AcrR family transcriptional regulator
MGLREQTRDAVRSVIAGHALALFEEKGFEATTVSDIAGRADISERSFFRYFPFKEDVVLDDQTPHGHLVREALLAVPIRVTPWPAMRAALEPIVEISAAQPECSRQLMRVIYRTASLRARNLERHALWEELLTPLITERLGLEAQNDVPAQAIVAAALSCLDVALGAWTDGDGSGSLGDLLDRAFIHRTGLVDQLAEFVLVAGERAGVVDYLVQSGRSLIARSAIAITAGTDRSIAAKPVFNSSGSACQFWPLSRSLRVAQRHRRCPGPARWLLGDPRPLCPETRPGHSG